MELICILAFGAHMLQPVNASIRSLWHARGPAGKAWAYRYDATTAACRY